MILKINFVGIFFSLVFSFISSEIFGQEEGQTNFSLLQYNQFLINPAYAGSTGCLSLDAGYLSIQTDIQGSPNQLNFSIHGPSGQSGLWGTGTRIEYFKDNYISAITFAPGLSYSTPLSNGTLAFGGSLGLSYFDFESGFSSQFVPKDLFSLLGGAGLYYHTETFFLGLSSPKIFETILARDQDYFSELTRERKLYLFTGLITRFRQKYMLKPSLLLARTDFYSFPDKGDTSPEGNWETAANLNISFDELYMLGVGLGTLLFKDNFFNYSYVEFSASVQFYNFRLGYGFRYLTTGVSHSDQSSVHSLIFGFDLKGDGEEAVFRYF